MTAQINKHNTDQLEDQSNWIEINEQYLAATIQWIHLRLHQLTKTTDNKSESLPNSEAIDLAQQEMSKLEQYSPPPALILLAKALGLSKFDRQVLALCAAMELNTRTAGLCAKAQGDANKSFPTFSLAFTLFQDPDWASMSPHAPLRYWRLLEINQPGAQPLTGAALAADERIINYLKGLNYLDDRLTPLLDPIDIPAIDETLPASQQQAVDNIIDYIQLNTLQRAPVIELQGHDSASKRMIAGSVALTSGLNLQAMSLTTFPGHNGDFETFVRLWQRESLLMPLALYIEIDEATGTEKSQLKRFLERNNSFIFIALKDTRVDINRDRLSVEVNKPTPEEQDHLWQEALQNQADEQSQRLSEQFSFNKSDITQLAKAVVDGYSVSENSLNKKLWQACRTKARAEMEQLARRIDTKSTWEQLVLPPDQRSLLQQITDQVDQRNTVYENWGFREKMNRGLGINALFAGESGTGKTMAAEVIANELELDLYRIDLSSVISKYIGETEKNLRKLFDAAEDSGAILFFDEADSLFGKRSEVKDSHDRYANIEINYLLQRMESYRGLAILATNMKSALDKAFVRRLRFIVDFPFPGIEERTKIWQKVFPSETPIDSNFDCECLSRLNLTGGNIHSIALNAAFLAARSGKPVSMPLILESARTEFRKLERPTKESDFCWSGSLEAVK